MEKESGPRCVCGSVTENSLSRALVPLLGAEPPRAGSGEKGAGCSHPPEGRGHFKDIVTGEMVRVIKLSVKCTLPGLPWDVWGGGGEGDQGQAQCPEQPAHGPGELPTASAQPLGLPGSCCHAGAGGWARWGS